MQIRNERFAFISWKDVKWISEALVAGCGADAPGSFAAWLSRQVPMHAFVMPGKRDDVGDVESYRVYVGCLSKADLFRRVRGVYKELSLYFVTRSETKQ